MARLQADKDATVVQFGGLGFRDKYLWAPPPAIAEVALEELRKARIKRQDSTHIFVCPRLMTPVWLKQFFKVADFVFKIPVKCSFWPPNMHEPCFVGICFPYLRCKPWCIRRTPQLLSFQRRLQKMWEVSEMAAGDLLRELRSF